MQYTVKNDTPFQILTSAIVIGPSQTGYQLEVAADGKNFSPLFTVGANVTRQATNLSSGAYYRLNGNVGDVIVNWVRSCVTPGGSGGSGTELSPVTEFPAGADAGTVVAYNGTASASGVYQYTGEEWVPVGVDDLSAYYTSAQTEDAISAATSGKADAANVSPNSSAMLFPSWNGEGIITGSVSPTFRPYISINNRNFERVTVGGGDWYSGGFYAPESAGTAGDILVSTGDGAPVWSAMTFPTPDVDKAYVDSAITAVEDHLYDVEQVTASALTELHEGLLEVSGRSVSTEEIELPIAAAVNELKGNIEARLNQKYYTRQEVNGIAAGKADPAQVNVQIKDYVDPAIAEVNDTIEDKELPVSSALNVLNTRLDALSQHLDDVEDVTAAAIVDLNTRKVESTSVHTIWRGTQAEYDAITTKDASTLYIIL